MIEIAAQIVDVVARILFVFVFFGACIFIHEFGHLLAALWRGLHIEKFSIGFGKPIVSWRTHGIDFQIGWLPFGGFVALPQLDPSNEPTTSDGMPLPPVNPIDRIITAFAGPLFNILFGFFLAIFIWKFGVEGPAPKSSFAVGHVPKEYNAADGEMRPTPEWEAGLRPGDRILAVNGEAFTKSWYEAFELIVYSPRGDVTLDVIRNGRHQTIRYKLVPNPKREGLGFPFFSAYEPTIVTKVIAGSPAMRAGLMAGDILLEIDGARIINTNHFMESVEAAGAEPIAVKVRRSGDAHLISGLRPVRTTFNGESRYMIGIQFKAARPEFILLFPTPWKQFTDVMTRTYKTLRGLFDRKNPIQARHMSGPLGIFRLLYKMFSVDFMTGLSFVILVSFSLALINLFPLPVLDGGHITSGIVESIIRRRIPARFAVSLQYTFAVVLIAFMLYVTYYDVLREWTQLRTGQQLKSETGRAPTVRENELESLFTKPEE